MTVKVGDIVKYNETDVRVMQIYRDDTRLANFGRTSISDSDIVESNTIPKFKVGDKALIQPIPGPEQTAYGPGWGGQMSRMVNNIHTISAVHNHNSQGELAKLNGYWFQTYHLEFVADYDIV